MILLSQVCAGERIVGRTSCPCSLLLCSRSFRHISLLLSLNSAVLKSTKSCIIIFYTIKFSLQIVQSHLHYFTVTNHHYSPTHSSEVTVQEMQEGREEEGEREEESQ